MESPPTTGRPDRRRLLALGAVLAVAVVTALAFARLFSGAVAWKLVLAGALATLLAGAMERRSLVLASVVSLAALIFYTFPFYVALLSTLTGREAMTPGACTASSCGRTFRRR